MLPSSWVNVYPSHTLYIRFNTYWVWPCLAYLSVGFSNLDYYGCAALSRQSEMTPTERNLQAREEICQFNPCRVPSEWKRKQKYLKGKNQWENFRNHKEQRSDQSSQDVVETWSRGTNVQRLFFKGGMCAMCPITETFNSSVIMFAAW